MEKVRCKGCKYFYVTWDKKFPYGCRALKFKSSQMPSAAVRGSSGMECQFYTPREKKDQ